MPAASNMTKFLIRSIIFMLAAFGRKRLQMINTLS